MPKSAKSLISTEQLSAVEIHSLFERADALRANDKAWSAYVRFFDIKPVVASCFFEPSTRTRLSFEMVCSRLGVPHISMGELSLTSQAKGETSADTFLNVKALNPDLIIVRYKNDERLDVEIENSEIPVISAGQGTKHHPTQALLDAYTIREKFHKLKGVKVVYCGDTAHSRVANSGRDILTKLGAEVAYCSPEDFLDRSAKNIKFFNDLSDAAEWADVVIGLRVQKERHGGDMTSKYKNFEAFRLDSKSLAPLSQGALIMHPGPFEPMVDFHPELLKDSRCRIHRQVTNGVFVRAALLASVLGLWRRDL